MADISETLNSRASAPTAGARSFPPLQASFDSGPFGLDSFGSPPSAAASHAIKLETTSDLAAAAAEWKAFEAIADCTPFQTFAWLEKWQRHIGAAGGVVPAIVFGRDSGGELLFILPLAIETRRGLRRLTWLGSGLGDYNAPLLSKSFAGHAAAGQFPAVWESVVELLRADSRYRFDLADLQKMPETIGGQQNPFLRLKVIPNRNGAYVATLGNNWEEFYAAKRSSSTRKTARRKQRQLEEHGKLRFVEIAEPSEAVSALKTLAEQKTFFFARVGVENIFGRQGYPEFYQAMATGADTGELVHVSRLDVGEEVGAVSVGLKFRGCYYLILSSYNAGEISRLGPGTVHLHELMRHCMERGFRHFDFTIGDEPYKLDWSDIKLTLHDHLAASTAFGALAVAVTGFQRGATRFIKQTPVLWRAAKKIRALTGRLKSSSGHSDERD